ncbi:MAG TPA: YhdP family protein [Burkholderiaceae bacterium]|nr:YhdP family protein [Burkholderiaceae bacterium]
MHAHLADARLVQFNVAPDDSQSSPPPGASHGGASGAFDRVEAVVEDAVERAKDAAERTARRHFGHHTVAVLAWMCKAIGLLVLIAYFLFGFLYLGTRYWLMPHIDSYRPRIEAAASRILGTKVAVDQIETGWRGIHPHLRLTNLRVYDAADNVALELPQLEATLSWTSVATWEPRFTALVIRTPELEVRRLPGNKFAVAGFVLEPDAPAPNGGLLDWVLAQQRIAIRDMRLHYVDETQAGPNGPAVLDIEDGEIEYRHGLLTHRLALRARAPSDLAGTLEMRMEFRHPTLERISDYRRWTGRIFAQADYADIARLVAMLHLPSSSIDLHHAQGAMRAWLQFDPMHVQRITADVALTDVDVQLARDYEPLRLAGIQGRFVQLPLTGAWQGGRELTFSKFSIVGTDGLVLPETDLKLRGAPFGGVFDLGAPDAAAPSRGEFTASRIRIEAILRLARHVPVLPAIQDELAARELHGELSDLEVTWQRAPNAPLRYSIATRFAELGSRGRDADPLTTRTGLPRPGLPGFENLSGSLTATEAGGKVSVDAEDAVLEFPGVFEPARLAPGRVKAAAGWVTEPNLELHVDSVLLSNADLELTGSGSYHGTGKGPGALDITARVTRLAAASGHLYAPLVLGPGVRAWLRTAFTEGEAVDASVRLRGDLLDFPFANGSGDFLVQAHLRDVALDYLSPRLLAPDEPAPKTRWPTVANLEGDLRVERNKLQFIGQRAHVFDTRLERIEVRVPELVSQDPHLLIGLGADGTAADVLRFVATSPIGGWLGNFLADTRAEGNAGTEIRLDVPLKDMHATRVNGTITLAGGDVALIPDVPTFHSAAGRIDFSESNFKLSNITAGFLGGQINVDGGMRADGPIVINGNGTATPAGLRRLVDVELVHRILDRAQGTTRYTGTLTLRGGRPELHVETGFAGWSLDLPAPLQKATAEEWPTRLEIEPQGETSTGARTDRVGLFINDKFAMQLARSTPRGGPAQVVGGLVRVGRWTPADVEAVPETGLRVMLDVPRLEVDRWTPLLSRQGEARSSGSSGTGAVPLPDLVSARIDELVYSGKTLANLVLGATRTTEGDDTVWLANVVSDNATGSVTWRMPKGDSPGRINARLTRLLIPDSNREQVSEVLEEPPDDAPALDIAVDSFELGSHKLGRLELIAQNTGTGKQAQWQLQQLEISNPDARMHATGRWYREPNAERRTMALDLAVEFNDAGRLLGRFGIPDALRGGEGTLEGQLSWRGTPLSIDYPSLSGSLKLASTKGQFLKADAGAGRLLGVLSLQSLPRRITLDFRDVFSEGFAFDSITATASIASGVISTRDVHMRSANATVLIEGSSDLRAETQNLHVLVLPEINAASASLVYALLANPAIGLGTFVAQLLLRDPLSKAFSFEYDVTGSWRDPTVKRLEHPAASNSAGAGALLNQSTPAQ